jgi:hypothetical protein
MGPNSRGGARNKDNNNPSVCARNRFSNWKPPTKNQKDKFVKQHESRNVKAELIKHDEALDRRTDTGGAKSGGISVVNTQAGKGNKGGALTQTAGELVTFAPAMLEQLAALFEFEHKETLQPGETRQSEVKSNRGKIVVLDTTVPPVDTLIHHLSDTKKQPGLKVVSNHQPSGRDALERRKVTNILTHYGFENAEITRLLSYWDDVPAKFRELEALLAALVSLTGDASVRPLSAEKCKDIADLSSNGELLSELDILSSIYGHNVVYRSEQLLGLPSCVIDISVPVEHDMLRGVAGLAVQVSDEHFVQIRLFVSNVDTYPSEASPLYGWVLPCSPTSSSDPQELPGTTPLLSPAAARQLSLSAMAHIRGYQAQFQAPASFEFIQHVRDGLGPALSLSAATQSSAAGGASASASGVAPGVKGCVTAFAGSGAPVSKAKVGGVELPAGDAVEGPPPMPPRPMTTFMQGAEYRTALGAALSTGLVGAAARAKAHAELEYILPKVSTLDSVSDMRLAAVVSAQFCIRKIILIISAVVSAGLPAHRGGLPRGVSEPHVLAGESVNPCDYRGHAGADRRAADQQGQGQGAHWKR